MSGAIVALTLALSASAEVRSFPPGFHTAASDQRPATEALEAAIHAAVLRNELLLMAGLDSKPHDIECRHIVLPTVKFPFPNNDAQNADTAGIRDARSVMGVFARVVPRA